MPIPIPLAGGNLPGPPPIPPRKPPPPPLPPLRPGGPIPGISKSGLPANSTSLLACACAGGGLRMGARLLNSPGCPGLQLGLTPRCETEVKFVSSDSAGERAPGRSSYEFVIGGGRFVKESGDSPWYCPPPGVRSCGIGWPPGGPEGIGSGSDANRGSTSS